MSVKYKKEDKNKIIIITSHILMKIVAIIITIAFSCIFYPIFLLLFPEFRLFILFPLILNILFLMYTFLPKTTIIKNTSNKTIELRRRYLLRAEKTIIKLDKKLYFQKVKIPIFYSNLLNLFSIQLVAPKDRFIIEPNLFGFYYFATRFLLSRHDAEKISEFINIPLKDATKSTIFRDKGKISSLDKKETKKFIIFCIIVFVVLYIIVFLIVAYVNITTKLSIMEEEDQLCAQRFSLNEQEDLEMRNDCYKELAIQNNDPSLCEKVKNPLFEYSFKSNCYYEVAGSLNLPELCLETFSKDDCLNKIFRNYIESEESVEIDGTMCEYYDEYENTIKCKAIISNNPDMCWDIEDEYILSNCIVPLAEKNSDYSLCENLIKNKDYCFFNYATSKNDIEICDLINDEYRNKTACYQIIANSLNDPSICDNISDETERQQCIETADY